MRKILLFIFIPVFIFIPLLYIFISPTESVSVFEPVATLKPETTPDLKPKVITVVALGDSLTEGIGSTDQSGYVGVVKKALKKREDIGKVIVHNYGQRGDETDDLVKVLKNNDVLKNLEKADIIFMTIGANDVMAIVEKNFFNLTFELFERKKQNYKNKMKEIFTIIRNHNSDAQLVYIGFYNPFSQFFSNIDEMSLVMRNWNFAGKSIANDFPHTIYVPTYDLFKGKERDLLAEDHFHPNDKGYELIGERVYDYLNKDKNTS